MANLPLICKQSQRKKLKYRNNQQTDKINLKTKRDKEKKENEQKNYTDFPDLEQQFLTRFIYLTYNLTELWK